MDTTAALDYLYSFVNFEAKPAEVYAPERFDLERVCELLHRLDNPQERYASVHIAGTKGKGSLAATVESVLRAAGYRTGLFTSPHLQDFRERIQVNREKIPGASLASLVSEVRPHVAVTPDITFYEISTVIALEWFARQRVDIAVIEVGLGGRLDATNVITPSICAITPISFDHMELLGDTIESIAFEKAGIIKGGVPVIMAPQPEAAHTVLAERAQAVGAPLIDVNSEWKWMCVNRTSTGQQFILQPVERPKEECLYQLPLIGAHQTENAVVTVALIQQLCEQGWCISQHAISQGLKSVQWPARCEIFPGETPIMIDCAHNRASSKRLVETLHDHFPGVRWVAVFGAMRDKDVSGMLAELMPDCSAAIMTSTGSPRAMRPHELVRLAQDHNCLAYPNADVASALSQGKHVATPEGLVVVTGSVAIAGAARANLIT
jgi:dihydrofolate synthase/folylpolyglutamate synthase